MMIWDEGTFTPEVEVDKGVRKEVADKMEADETARAGLRDGNLKFHLYGKKLSGSFALVRTKGLGGQKEAWLLIKHKDQHCKTGYNANDYDFSAASNRTLTQIAEGSRRDGES